MAGEWIPIDISLESKPEVLKLLARTGLPREVVVYRLWRLWGWFALNSSDGTIDATPELMALACGGDAEWWRAVEAVGWLQFDAQTEKATLPGWDTRFSKAAKARLLNARRQSEYRAREAGDGAEETAKTPENPCSNATVTHDRYGSVTNRNGGETLNRGDRGEENRGEEEEGRQAGPASTTTTTTTTKDAPQAPRKPRKPAGGIPAAWGRLRAAWNAGAGQRWDSSRPPPAALARLAEPGWLDAAIAAIPKLAEARFFTDPVPLTQFCGEGFADRLANDHYARPKRAARHGGDERPPAQQFTGEVLDDFEYTKRKLAAELRAREAAT
jgi:hypothetical protein